MPAAKPTLVPPRDPDLDIVQLAQNRKHRRAAMGVLYERFRGRVYNTALRIVGDHGAAEDILQDVFVTLFRRIHRFKVRATFAAWVYRITVNASLDHLRRRRRGPRGTLPQLETPTPSRELTLPEHGAALHDLRSDVAAALDDVSERLRVVLVLRYLEGLSYQEIAASLAISIGTVKSRLSRAHAALRIALRDRYGDGTVRTA